MAKLTAGQLLSPGPIARREEARSFYRLYDFAFCLSGSPTEAARLVHETGVDDQPETGGGTVTTGQLLRLTALQDALLQGVRVLPDRSEYLENDQAAAWQAAASLPPRDYAFLHLYVRYGLGLAELAFINELSLEGARAIHSRILEGLQALYAAKILAKDRGCPEVAALVQEERGINPQAERRIARHYAACDVCRRLMQDRPDAVAVYASLPLAEVPRRWSRTPPAGLHLAPVQRGAAMAVWLGAGLFCLGCLAWLARLSR